MDHHHHRHNHHQPQRHHHQQHNSPSEFIDSRYYHRSLPPPPPPPYPDNPNLYPPPPPPPPRHLPPPPQQPPPPSHSFYHPPPPPRPPPPQQPHPYHHQQHRHFDDVNFINSPPRHHRRHLPVDDDLDPYRRHSLGFGPNSPPRVFDHHHHHHHRDDDQHRRFHLPEQPPRVPPPVAPIDARPDSGLDWEHHHRPVSLDRLSPTPFIEPIDDRFRRDSRDFESLARFRDDLNIDQGFRLRQDELWHRRDDRRIVSSSNLERDDHRHHEEYRPEMLLGEFEPVMENCVRGPEIDEELFYDEGLNVRHGGSSREVSRSPIKFRNRGIDLEERLHEYYEEGGSSSGRYSERGGRREELQEYNNRTTPRKKSAFLRIQEPVRHNTSGSFRNNNKFINASSSSASPHKSKESLEFLDRRVASEERHGSPVELDVSFKSNALIAKAITTGPSLSSDLGPKDNSADTKVDGQSPVKEDSGKNSGGSKPFVSRKDEKGSENRIKKSPVMKRVGLKTSVEVHGSNSESSSSGSSSLSGGSSGRGSPKGEVLDKDDTKAGSDRVSLPNFRTKRKSVLSLSRLSSSVSKDTDGKVVNRDSSASPSSKSCMSDKRVKQSGDDLSSGGKVVGPTESKVIVDTHKLDVNVASDTNAGSDKVSSPDVDVSDKNTGSDKVSSPNLRKRRKSIISRSCLSSSLPTKTDAKVVNADSSANPSSENCMSDKCLKQSGEGLSSGGHKVIGPMRSEVVVDTEKADVNASSVGVEGETMGQSVSEASLPKELRKSSSLEKLHDSQEARAPDNPGNVKGSFQEIKEASNSDDDESEFVEICELDSDVECRSTRDQAIVTLLVSSGSGEGSSEPMTCMGGDVDNNNDHCGNVESHNSIDINNSIWSPVQDSNMTQDEGDLTCIVVDNDKPCDTQVNMSNERSVVGQSCVDLHLNRDSNQAELRNSGNMDKSSNTVYSIKTINTLSCDHAPVDHEKVSTASDIRSTSGSEEQRTAGTTLVNEAREESLQACISKFGQSSADLPLNRDTNQAELRDCGDSANLERFSIIDVHSFKRSTAFSNDVSIDAEKVTTASDIRTTDDSEEQQCQGAITTLVDNEGREGSSQACIGMVSDSTIVSMDEDISPISRKRKFESKLYSLDSGISEAFPDTTKRRSFPIMDLNLPIVDLNLPTEKLGPEVSGSPCRTAESDVLHGSELMESCLDGSISLNLGSYLDPVNRFSSCSKKQKILSLESVSPEALVSVNSDIPASLDSLNVFKYSTESAEGIGLSSCVLPTKDVDAATNSVLTTTNNFADSYNAELCLRGPFLSPKDSTLSCEKQPCDLSESKCKQNENVDSMMAEASDGSESIPLESNAGMARNDQNGGVYCLRDDHSGVSENEFLVTDMECESNMAANGNSPSVSDCTHWCAEYGVAGYSNSQELPSNVGSSGADSLLTTTLHISDTVSAPSVMSEEKLGMDDKSLNDQVASSNSSPLFESNRKILKPPISASAVDKPFTQKIALIPLKNAKNTVSNSNATSRQLIRRNVLIRGDTSFPSSRVSSVTSYPNNAASTFPAKPRTWRRTDSAPAANAPVKKASVVTALPQRPPIDKSVKFQGTSRTSYIRKGNSLVRNPASAAATLARRSFGASINQSKPNDTNIIKNMGSPGTIDSTVVSDCPVTEGRSAPIEMPRTPPLPSTGKTSSCDIVATGDCKSFPLEVQSEGLGNGEAVKSSETSLNSSGIPEIVDKHLEDTGTMSDGCLPVSNAKRIVYIKRKSNQLIAASNPSEPSMHNVDRAPALSSDNNYYKRRKNQLIRASSESNIQQMVSVMDDSSNSQPQRPLNIHSGRSSTKRQVNKVKPQKVSLVWKLGDTKSFGKGFDMLRYGKILSHLLPWKRATYWRSAWKNTVNFSNSSPMKTRKLLSSRKRATLYVRSGRGFSLRRSKVIGLGGSSLKWSKSMERRSKKVNEEATAAAAAAVAAMGSVERHNAGTSGVISTAAGRSHVSQKPVPSLKLNPGERIFRIGVFRYRMDPSRRSLQRIPDEELSNSSASKPLQDARKTYVPKRLLIGSDEYIRIGNGNQLVRDPKRRTRMLASEKVRWSLHTARMRLAKKRKFCQFFTRFGECKKGEGRCPYIHDPSKIAVCTKFLNGFCGDPNCKLTHKVIPERMPDCSFFLQGLCSNENCPYRHVNVNPKASICESFLRGYCAEGNECRKKHTYICPEFEATGSCAQGAKCKLYHPKKGKGSKKRKLSKDQRNARGRYFGSELKMVAEPEIASAEKQVAPKEEPLSFQGELGDFISLDASDDDTEEKSDPNSEPTNLPKGDALSSQFDDLEELIKPLRLFNRALGSNVQALSDLPPLNSHHYGERTEVQGR